MDCYNKFASVYDELIYEDIDYYKWCDKIFEICNEFKVSRKKYMDLACGTGNFTLQIGKKFDFTTAIDFSEEMLAVAEEKLREENIRAKVLCQNICNIRIDKKFDLITCGLDSTNYILDNEGLKSYFKGVYNHLEDDGIFIFDINSEYKLRNILGNNIFNYDNDEVVYIWENIIEDDIVNMYLTFFIKDGDVYRRFDENHREKIISDSLLRQYISDANLEVLKVMDNYEDNEVNDKTERITYVLRKIQEDKYNG